MKNKLEVRLAEYERHSPISNDIELLCALDLIIDEQSKLPPHEKDPELLEEAIDMALTLRGEDVTALEAEANKASEKYIKTSRPPKSSLPFALILKRRSIAVALVLIIATTCMVGFTSAFDWLSEYISEKMLDGDLGENVYYSTAEEHESIDDMIEKFNINGVLLPRTFPDNISPTMITSQISYSKSINSSDMVYSCIFNIRSAGDASWQEIIIETLSLGTTAVGKKMKLGGREVTYYFENGRNCALFTYNGYTYTVTATNFDELEVMISCLE